MIKLTNQLTWHTSISIFSKFTDDHSIFNLKASKEFFFLGGSHDSGDSFPPILTAGEILEVDVGALT